MYSKYSAKADKISRRIHKHLRGRKTKRIRNNKEIKKERYRKTYSAYFQLKDVDSVMHSYLFFLTVEVCYGSIAVKTGWS